MLIGDEEGVNDEDDDGKRPFVVGGDSRCRLLVVGVAGDVAEA